MDVVIIEDEIQTAQDLRDTILKLNSNTNVLSVLDSVEAGLEWFSQNKNPDVIFSDIQLGDGLAFDIFRNITLTCPVIFCTAYDSYAIEAFKNNGIDYLLKPINEELLKQSLQKIYSVQGMHVAIPSMQILENIVKEIISHYKQYKSTFLVSYREKIIPVNIAEILLFKIDGANVKIKTRSGSEYIVNYTLDELESKINPKEFFRANRQYLISYHAIKEAENYFERKLLVRLTITGFEEIVVSKAKATAFIRWMEDH